MSILKKAALATGLFEEEPATTETHPAASEVAAGPVASAPVTQPSLDHALYDSVKAKVYKHPSALSEFLTNMTALEAVIPDKDTRTKAALATCKATLEAVKKAVAEHVSVLKTEISTATNEVASEQKRITGPLQEQIAQLDQDEKRLDEEIRKLIEDRDAVRHELAAAHQELNATTAKATEVMTQLDLIQRTIEAELNQIV